jgi:hypothetical protein
VLVLINRLPFLFMVRLLRRGLSLLGAGVLLSAAAAPARGASLNVPPAARVVLDQIYSGDLAGALEGARRLQQERPDHPLGYLLEAEALWWRIWCSSAEFKYRMTYPRHRAKLAADQRYLDVSAKVSALSAAQIAAGDTAEARFYAGMGAALSARLYGLRGEARSTARYGVRAREDLLRAIALDSGLADADFGLGLYNYYADTLSAGARILRFFMGIPGGNKQDGIRQLEHAFKEGTLSPPEARFYLAISLHNYDQQYQRALEVAEPLVEKYPTNPLFQLILGDLYRKLGRTAPAVEHYRAAAALPFGDAECRSHIRELARLSLAAIGASTENEDAAPRPN